MKPISPNQRPHGKGGVAIAWKTHLTPYICQLKEGNDRIVCCTISLPEQPPVLLVAVYLPSQRNSTVLDELEDHLALIGAILDKFRMCSILLGDLNSSLSSRDLKQDRALKRFVELSGLFPPKGFGEIPTYVHSGLGHSSQLDYIITNSNSLISHCLVMEHCPCNTSKHTAVWATLNICKPVKPIHTSASIQPATVKPK